MTTSDRRLQARAKALVVSGVTLILASIALMTMRFTWHDSGIWTPILVATCIGGLAGGAKLIVAGRNSQSAREE